MRLCATPATGLMKMRKSERKLTKDRSKPLRRFRIGQREIAPLVAAVWGFQAPSLSPRAEVVRSGGIFPGRFIKHLKSKSRWILTAAVFAVSLDRRAYATSYTYVGPNGGSFVTVEGSPWSPSGYPNSGDDVFVGPDEPGGDYSETVNMNYAAGLYTNGGFDSLNVSAPATSTMEIDQEPSSAGQSALETDNLYLDDTSKYVQGGAGTTSNQIEYLSIGGEAEYDITSSNATLTDSSELEDNGVFKQTGGSATINDLDIYGTLSVNDAAGASSMTATYTTVDGGIANLFGGNLQLNETQIRNGTLNIGGTANVTASDVYCGFNDADEALYTGMINQTGGTFTATGALNLGNYASSSPATFPFPWAASRPVWRILDAANPSLHTPMARDSSASLAEATRLPPCPSASPRPVNTIYPEPARSL